MFDESKSHLTFINGHPVLLAVTPDLDSLTGNLGECLPVKQQIHITNGLDPYVRLELIIHECMEMINYQLTLGLTGEEKHKTLNAFSELMTATITDNQWILDELVEQAKRKQGLKNGSIDPEMDSEEGRKFMRSAYVECDKGLSCPWVQRDTGAPKQETICKVGGVPEEAPDIGGGI